jgi:DNA repair protein RecO (recombination protein O)
VAARKSTARHTSEALLLRRVEYGESDLVLTLLTRSLGKVSALARGARRSSKRFGSALEPMHTLRIELEERPGAELFTLTSAQLQRPRAGILRSLHALEAAGRALSWVRRAAPPRTPEEGAYAALEGLLDSLADAESATAVSVALGAAGLALLSTFGWGIDFERCVRCGRQATERQSASVDAARGGLICRNCGGARVRLTAAARERMARAAAGDSQALLPEDSAPALDLVDAALGAHAGIE